MASGCDAGPSAQLGDSRPRHVPQLPLGRRIHRPVAADRLRPRSDDRRGDGRRPARRRLRRRAAAAQPVPRHLRRGRVQLGLCADLFARAGRARRRRRQSSRQPRLHPAADLADRAARRGAGLHRPARRADRAGLLRAPGEVRARRRHDAHHLPLSRLHHAGDAAQRHAQRARLFQRRRFRAGAAQSVRRRLPRASPFSFPTPA